MSYTLSKRSRDNLEGVNPALVAVVKLALKLTKQDFMVIEGLRSKARQRELYDKGASRTLKSKHLTGDAVDLSVWPVDWDDIEGYKEVGRAMLAASKALGFEIRWGADWDGDGLHTDHGFLDWVHFEVKNERDRKYNYKDTGRMGEDHKHVQGFLHTDSSGRVMVGVPPVRTILRST